MRRTGVGALAGAKKFRFQQRFGDGAAVDRDEGTFSAMAARVHGAGDQLLAGAGLAAHQYRRHAARDFRDPLLHVLHHRGLADQALKGDSAARRTVGAGRRARSTGTAGAGLRFLDRSGDHTAELFQVDRLGEVVESAGFQRLHGVLRGAICRHHDAALRTLLLQHPVQELQSQPVRQAHVGDDGVEAMRSQLLPRFRERASRFHPIAFTQQREFVEGAQVGLVIDDEHMGGKRCDGHQAAIVSNDEFPASAGPSRRNTTKNSLPCRFAPVGPTQRR